LAAELQFWNLKVRISNENKFKEIRTILSFLIRKAKFVKTNLENVLN